MDYDVALSFAGEDRDYVEKVARALTAAGLKVFYDNFNAVDLWGKDLYSHLVEIYSRRAFATVIFVSKAYSEKAWPTLERRAAQERALTERREYILPARFDDTDLPGMLSTTGYVNLLEVSPEQLASMIVEKVSLLKYPRATAYGSRTNAELISEAMSLVTDLRDAAESLDDFQAQCRDAEDRERKESHAEDEGSERWRKYRDMEHNAQRELSRKYDRVWKVRAILLRDEMRKRLPSDPRRMVDRSLDHSFERPGTGHGLGEVTDHLEWLARNLPT